jgi:hypothetical protein
VTFQWPAPFFKEMRFKLYSGAKFTSRLFTLGPYEYVFIDRQILDDTTVDACAATKYEPIYAGVYGKPPLRVENRVLPAGPTVVDAMANAAFYYGLVRALVDQERPLWSQMSFSAAEENFHSGARYGIDAMLYWPGLGSVPAAELVLRRLLPMAHAGLAAWGVDAGVRDRLLGLIEARCVNGTNGASWQVDTVRWLNDDRVRALHGMLQRYVENMHTNEPVHTWERAAPS